MTIEEFHVSILRTVHIYFLDERFTTEMLR